MGADNKARVAEHGAGEDAFRDALMADPEIGVALIDDSGVVRQANAAAAHLLCPPGAERLEGMTLTQALGADVAGELAPVVERARVSGAMLIVEGTWHGTRVRWVLHPAGDGAVLAVIRRAPYRLRREDLSSEVVPLHFGEWGALGSLSERERHVLGLIGQGMTAQQISRKLGRSVKTIDAHRRSIGKKLRVRNRVELARIAVQAGLSPLSPR